MPEFLYKSFPVSKVTKGDDGDVYVEGLATDGSLDHDQQIVDPAWAADAFKSFFATGANLRMAHDPHRPVGVGVDWRQEPDGGIWVKSCVVDRDAQRLVKKRVLRAYSVGISHARIVQDSRAPAGRIASGSLAELSLVDRPSNPNSYVKLATKGVGGLTVLNGEVFRDGAVVKAADLAADPVRSAEESLRAYTRAALQSVDPRFRAMAEEVLRGQDRPVDRG